jgi:hypothetical protein
MVVAAALFASCAVSQPKNDSDVTWLVGTWEKTVDEDSSSPADTITFKGDGTWISFGPGNKQMINTFHLYGGDVYLTLEMQSQGPVALVFRPSKDRTRLVFTSPRTINNATYERAGNR